MVERVGAPAVPEATEEAAAVATAEASTGGAASPSRGPTRRRGRRGRRRRGRARRGGPRPCAHDHRRWGAPRDGRVVGGRRRQARLVGRGWRQVRQGRLREPPLPHGRRERAGVRERVPPAGRGKGRDARGHAPDTLTIPLHNLPCWCWSYDRTTRGRTMTRLVTTRPTTSVRRRYEADRKIMLAGVTLSTTLNIDWR